MIPPLRSLPCTVILVLGLAAPAGAQTFTVTTPLDSAGACTAAACSLRAAVVAANAGTGGDVIDVPPGDYLLPAGQLAISRSMRIRGTAGRDDTRLRPGFGTRALNIGAGTTVVLEHLTVTGARLAGAGTLEGAAILSAGDLTLSDVALTDNVVTKTDPGGIPQGGALSATGPTTILDSSLTRNVVRGGSIPQGGAVSTTGPLTVRRSEFRENAAETITGGGVPQGGAINAGNGTSTGPLIIDASQLTGNSVLLPGGGGIPQAGALNVYGMVTAITGSVISRNIASGGAIPAAAAISAFRSDIDVTGTTIDGNLAIADGGASVVDAPFVFGNGVLKLTNTTVSGNRAVGPVAGGSALRLFGQSPATPATLTLTNVTLAGNTSTGSGASGPIVVGDNSSATVRNTIVSGNLANGVAKGCGAPNLPTSGGHNLSDDPSCGFAAPGDRTGAAGLAALADNGGPTPTRALLAGSPAIDAGDPGLCTTTDQRGVARVGTCDIGAFEFVPPPTPVVPPAASTPVTPKAAVKPLNASRVLVLPSGKRCLSRRTITLHLRLPAGAVAKTVSVKIGTQKPTVFSGRRLKAPINLRGLRKGAYTVTVTLRTTDGRSASLKRAYRTCTIKKKPR